MVVVLCMKKTKYENMKNFLFILLNSNRISNEDLLKWGTVVAVGFIVIVAFFIMLSTGRTLFFPKEQETKNKIPLSKK